MLNVNAGSLFLQLPCHAATTVHYVRGRSGIGGGLYLAKEENDIFVLLAKADEIRSRQACSRCASITDQIPWPADFTRIVVCKNAFGERLSNGP